MGLPDYDNLKKWVAFIGRQHYTVRYGVAALGGAMALLVCVNLLSTYSAFPPIRNTVPAEGRVPTPPPDIATFGNKWPRTNVGTEWNLISDSKFLNESSVWYETVAQSNDYFLRIHFALHRGARSLIGDAYGGVYFEWTEPPPERVDAAGYKGVRFRAAYSLTNSGSKPQFLLSVATAGTPNFEYHEYDFSGALVAPGAFTTVEVPFSLFRVPDWATVSDAKRPLDPSKIFRVSIVMKGLDQAGFLDIDDLVFVPLSRPVS